LLSQLLCFAQELGNLSRSSDLEKAVHVGTPFLDQPAEESLALLLGEELACIYIYIYKCVCVCVCIIIKSAQQIGRKKGDE
jgi:hypothetical protein